MCLFLFLYPANEFAPNGVGGCFSALTRLFLFFSPTLLDHCHHLGPRTVSLVDLFPGFFHHFCCSCCCWPDDADCGLLTGGGGGGRQVGRTKSCPVATSRPQRLLAVRDLQDPSLAAPVPLALRSRGDFVWPPTTLSSHEATHEIADGSDQIPVTFRESSMHVLKEGTAGLVGPFTPLPSLAASPQTPSPGGVSPHSSHSYYYNRNSPCTEKDSVCKPTFKKYNANN